MKENKASWSLVAAFICIVIAVAVSQSVPKPVVFMGFIAAICFGAYSAKSLTKDE